MSQLIGESCKAFHQYSNACTGRFIKRRITPTLHIADTYLMGFRLAAKRKDNTNVHFPGHAVEYEG